VEPAVLSGCVVAARPARDVSTLSTLLDDATGHAIPDGAAYYAVTVRPYNPGFNRMNTYQDTVSITSALAFARLALFRAKRLNEPPPTIEITGRTHHKL
jgi:hypothetical protein